MIKYYLLYHQWKMKVLKRPVNIMILVFVFVLYVFQKSKSDVVALVGDTDTNQVYSRLFVRPFLGCYSHRFQLSVKDIIVDNKYVVNVVHRRMRKLSFSIPAVILRRKTPLHVKCANITC